MIGLQLCRKPGMTSIVANPTESPILGGDQLDESHFLFLNLYRLLQQILSAKVLCLGPTPTAISAHCTCHSLPNLHCICLLDNIWPAAAFVKLGGRESLSWGFQKYIYESAR